MNYLTHAEQCIDDYLTEGMSEISVISNTPFPVLILELGLDLPFDSYGYDNSMDFDEVEFDKFLTEYNERNNTEFTILEYTPAVLSEFRQTMLTEGSDDPDVLEKSWGEYENTIGACMSYRYFQAREEAYEMIISPGDECGKTVKIVGNTKGIVDDMKEALLGIYGSFVLIMEDPIVTNYSGIRAKLFTEQFETGSDVSLVFGRRCSVCGDFYKIFPGMMQFCCSNNESVKVKNAFGGGTLGSILDDNGII
jgi:hypothetical protein